MLRHRSRLDIAGQAAAKSMVVVPLFSRHSTLENCFKRGRGLSLHGGDQSQVLSLFQEGGMTPRSGTGMRPLKKIDDMVIGKTPGGFANKFKLHTVEGG